MATKKSKNVLSPNAEINRLARDVQKALDALPGTPKEVAEFLLERGITGELEGLSDCPIARYLQEEVSELMGVEVLPIAITIKTDAIALQVPTPETVKAFTEEFDRKKYKKLIQA